MRNLIGSLSLTGLAITLDTADGTMDDHTADIEEMQAACDEFAQKADDAIKGVNFD